MTRIARVSPLDLVVMIYAAFNVVVLLFGRAHVEHGSAWLLGFVLYFGLAVSMRWAPTDLPRPLRFVRESYPLLLLGPAYFAAGVVNHAVFQSAFDDVVLQWDAAVFGGHPNTYFAERFPSVVLSECLHFCYYFYLWLVPLLGVVLFLQRREREFRETTAVIIATFYLCYMIFTLFPVEGPYYTFPRVEALGSVFPALVYSTLERGASVGTAFPSSHCAAATVIAMMAIRHTRRLSIFVTAVAIGIVFATVYGGFHYAIDSLAGVLLGLILGILLPLAHRRFAVA